MLIYCSYSIEVNISHLCKKPCTFTRNDKDPNRGKNTSGGNFINRCLQTNVPKSGTRIQVHVPKINPICLQCFFLFILLALSSTTNCCPESKERRKRLVSHSLISHSAQKLIFFRNCADDDRQQVAVCSPRPAGKKHETGKCLILRSVEFK